MGDCALLLILDHIRIDPTNVEQWRDRWREAKHEPDPSEADFYAEYDACLEKAFAYGLDRFE